MMIVSTPQLTYLPYLLQPNAASCRCSSTFILTNVRNKYYLLFYYRVTNLKQQEASLAVISLRPIDTTEKNWQV